MPPVVVVHAIHRSGGARVRVDWWRECLAASGFETAEISLLDERTHFGAGGLDSFGAIASGSAAVETLAWSGRKLMAALEETQPAAVVAITLRAFDRSHIPAGVPIVLDYVDSLAMSYRQRLTIEQRRLHRLAWRFLARSMSRVEAKTASRDAVPTVAAGRRDAFDLGAAWIPITLPARLFVDHDDPQSSAAVDRAREVLFTGTLDYPPNVAALRSLTSTIWPAVVARRPGSLLTVAGRRPGLEVRSLLRSAGAELVEDFSDYPALAATARLAIAPLPFATGMQIKVLDAASSGLPMVATPAVASGFDPDFPMRVTEPDESFASAIVELLDDPSSARELAKAAFEHARTRYCNDAVASQVSDLIDAAIGAHPA